MFKTLTFWTYLLLFFMKTSAVFDEREDITQNPSFGCRWTGGGLDSTVTCTCRDTDNSQSQEFYIQKGSIPSYETVIINIENCNRVRFGSDAVSEMRNLRTIKLVNIRKLNFESSALSWYGYIRNGDLESWDRTLPGLKISIENCNIENVASYTFQGRIIQIFVGNSLIEKLSSFAFSSLSNTQDITFDKVQFRIIHTQAFKKFPVEFLTIADSQFDLLPSRTFSDIEVLETLTIRNCDFKTINPGAFLIQKPKKFEISNSRIEELDGDGFKVLSRGSVKISENNFQSVSAGAFKGIALDMNEIPSEGEIIFRSNSFTRYERNTFAVDTKNFNVKHSATLVNVECTCGMIEFLSKETIDTGEFFCLFKEGEKLSLAEFKKYNCSVLSSYSNIIIVLGVALILFVVIFSGLAIYFRRANNKRLEYLNDRNGKPISLIMPDGKTYRETELHVIVERADLLTTDL